MKAQIGRYTVKAALDPLRQWRGLVVANGWIVYQTPVRPTAGAAMAAAVDWVRTDTTQEGESHAE